MKRLFLSVIAAVAAFGGTLQAGTHNVLNFKANAGSAVTAGKRLVDHNGSYSLACWCKLDKVTGWNSSYPDGPIMCQDGDKAYMFRFYYNKPNDQIIFSRRHGWSYADGDYTRVTAPAAGEWHFLTAVWDVTAQKRYVYIDGVVAGESNDTNVYTPDNVAFRFGYAEWAHYFRGQLAEMSVWKKALSAAEIQTIMSKRPSGDDLADCVAYWPLGEGDGGTASADIVNGNNLTIG